LNLTLSLLEVTMASFNKVVLVGNLTRVPELRHIPSGLAVTDIGLAVNDRRKSATGEWIEEVTFVDITVWGRWAEIVCEHATKGSQLLVEGRLKQDSWESEGQKRSKLKVIAERTMLLGPKGGSRGSGGYDDGGYAPRQQNTRSSSSGYSAPPQQDYYDNQSDGDDVPF
jgi:single-strand DNA-binding protein